MKKILFGILTAVLMSSMVFSQTTYPFKTLIDIQKVPLDSLKIADSLGFNASQRWLAQAAPGIRGDGNGDTLTIVVLVTVPPYKTFAPAPSITYTAGGRTMAVVDTGAKGYLPWSGILVRCGYDSATADANGMFNIERGDIVRMTGLVQEFPITSMNSLTQFAPLPEYPFEVLSSGNPIPPPAKLNVADFNIGQNPGGKIMWTTGEPYEAKEVQFVNLTVGGNVNTSRGTFWVEDAFKNQLSDYDWSFYFTLGHGGTTPIAGDPSYQVPPAGIRIDSMRGYISTSSGGEANRGFRICPIAPGDIGYGKLMPGLRTHRRYPVIVAKDTSPLITVQSYRQKTAWSTGAALKSVQVIYSVNNGSWQQLTMTATQPSVDSLYQVRIPVQSIGSTVRYFVKSTDSANYSVIVANSGSLTLTDTALGFFFYKVLDRTAQPVLSIKDVQYTPYLNGRSPYIGSIDSVGGVITADTSSLRLSPISPGYSGTNAFYMQSGNQPWSGIWIVGPDSLMLKLKNGDSVVVKGSIQENYEVTRIENITSARIVTRGNPIPSPVKIKTEIFGPGIANGNPGAEPYEGMLVKFDTVTVFDVSPVYDQPTEFEVTNSLGPVLVRRDGRHMISNVLGDTILGYQMIYRNTKFSSLTGVIYYNNNRYKVVPRTIADFGTITNVKAQRELAFPETYALEQNYPNPFNPSTTIRYSIPEAGYVSLRVYNLLGQEVAGLIDYEQAAGTYTVRFDGSSLSSGVYLYRIRCGNFVQVHKMMLLK